MSIVQLLVLLLVIFILGCAAYWIINRFVIDPTARMITLLVVGVVLLLILLTQFFPGAGSLKVW